MLNMDNLTNQISSAAADQTIKISYYMKRALIYCFVLIFGLFFPCLIYELFVPGQKDSISWLLGAIIITYTLFCLYLAFLGARRFITNPNSGTIYYFWVLPIAVLSCVIMAVLGLEVGKLMCNLTNVISCDWFGLFLFFGGGVMGIPIFIFLLISGVLELYLIKRSIRKRLIQQTQGFINPKSR